MSRDSWERNCVLCPFYKGETRAKIICEGPEEKSSIHTAFSEPAQKKEYAEKYCERDWESCVIARALTEKY